MPDYLRPDGKIASSIMWETGMGGGGLSVHCSCGIEHNADDTDDVEEDGWPESFQYIELDGLLFVDGCAGCEKKLAQYESFIWKNRDHIRRYLKMRIDKEREWAEQETVYNIMAGIEE